MNFKTIFLIIALIIAGYFCFNEVPSAKQVNDTNPVQHVELKRPPVTQPVKESDISIASSEDTRPIVLYFYADWCGACKQFKPTYNAVKKRVSGYRYIEVNVDKNEKLADYFNVPGMPSIYIYDKKYDYKKDIGIMSLEKKLRDYLEERGK